MLSRAVTSPEKPAMPLPDSPRKTLSILTTRVGAARSPGARRPAKTACKGAGRDCAIQVAVGSPALAASGETSTRMSLKRVLGGSGVAAPLFAPTTAKPTAPAARKARRESLALSTIVLLMSNGAQLTPVPLGCSGESHLQDFIAFAAARRVHLDRVAFFLADQSAGRRRSDGDPAGFHVRLRLADNLQDFFLFGVLVDKRHCGPELHGIAGKLRNVDNFRALQLVLELEDPALVQGLSLFRGVIFRVLRQIAMAARFCDRLDDAGALDLLQPLKLLKKLGMPSGGDRKLLHSSTLP